MKTEKKSDKIIAKRKPYSPLIATTAAGLLQQAPLIYNAWLLDPDMIVPYTSAEELKVDIDAFEQLLYKLSALTATKTPKSGELLKLNQKIELYLSYPKDRLRLQVGKEAYRANLPRLGIYTKKGYYRFPYRMGERKIALATLVATAKEYNWTEAYCSATFWQELLDKYTALTSVTTNNSQKKSVLVGNKNRIAKRIRKVLHGISKILRAQYPDTYESVLRSWGFLRK